METPKVSECSAAECAYNSDGMCHAMAITVGDVSSPQCDTYCTSSMKGGDYSCIATVGACKVSNCLHNMDLECQAPSIRVGHQGGEVDCLTFCAE
ncbi:MAG TPA: DUF1540 domain-containing protein [Phycisphaerae bacterium]|nr:DUF1540 domain-containing protein [Phycisphaerae bacterium]